MIILPELFEILKKSFFLTILPFCEANERRSKSFLNKYTVTLMKNLN